MASHGVLVVLLALALALSVVTWFQMEASIHGKRAYK